MKVELICIGEIKPDFVSKWIQRGLSWLHGVPVNYSHIGILIDETRLFHATGKGFHESPLVEELSEGTGSLIRERYELLGMTEGDEREFLGWLDGHKDTYYSNLQYVGILFPFLMPIVRYFSAGTVCSSSGARALKKYLALVGKRDPLLAGEVIVDPYVCIALGARWGVARVAP